MGIKYSECVQKKLLRKVPASTAGSKQSIKKAELWLDESLNSFKAGNYNLSVLGSYLAMFHSARAILFRDGWREKSHACVARYIEEHYAKTGKLDIKWIQLFDFQRNLRHNDQYDMSFTVTDKEAENAIKSSASFIDEMKKLLD